MNSPADDPIRETLDVIAEVEETLRANIERARLALEKLTQLRALLGTGQSFTDLFEAAEPPLVMDLVTESLEALATSGARLRRVAAHVLHDEGLSTERIATLFGVSRQRVSRLLHADPDTTGPHWRRK